MGTCLVLHEQQGEVEIPLVNSLNEFRVWARSNEFPEQGRIDYIAGRVEVDMSPEDLHTHGKVKSEIAIVLGQRIKARQLGEIYIDRTRVSCPAAELSAEPDVVFVSDDALDSGRVRLIPKAGSEPDRYVELEGPPDLFVEIVSDSSEVKDLSRLPEQYWRAGVGEFWLADARGEDLVFRIERPGPTGYRPAQGDAAGFQYSEVLATWFRLVRRRNRHGRWEYDLQQRGE